MKYLEIAAFNLDSVIIAQNNGADKVELCQEMSVGGITPNIDVLKQARALTNIDIYVMIRPRGGNFNYSDQEFEEMLNSIQKFKALGVNGFVFGVLTEQNSIDIKRNKKLVNAASPYPCTFHRAFDEIQNFNQGLEDIISCGFSTLLSSGLAACAMDGLAILKQMVDQANTRIHIMPGGGVRSSNTIEILQATGANFIHSSAITSGITADALEIYKIKQLLRQNIKF